MPGQRLGLFYHDLRSGWPNKGCVHFVEFFQASILVNAWSLKFDFTSNIQIYSMARPHGGNKMHNLAFLLPTSVFLSGQEVWKWLIMGHIICFLVVFLALNKHFIMSTKIDKHSCTDHKMTNLAIFRCAVKTGFSSHYLNVYCIPWRHAWN